jgi:gamma-tubulin complex component 4
VEWPFHTLISPKVLKKYNEIFAFLLQTRRVQMQLNKCFGLQIRLKKMGKAGLEAKVAAARLHMSFLVDNLQFYLQADVLETQFAELEKRIAQSKDFEQIRFAHDTFLTKIQTQTFLLNKTVRGKAEMYMVCFFLLLWRLWIQFGNIKFHINLKILNNFF